MFEWLQGLTKSENDRIIGGVCGGLAEHSQLPSWAWRVIACLVSLVWGFGVVIYILLWIFMPAPSKNPTGE